MEVDDHMKAYKGFTKEMTCHGGFVEVKEDE